MQNRKRTLARSSVIALTSFLATTLFLFMTTAASSGQQQAQPAQELKSKDVSDAELKKFTKAFGEVQTLRMELQQKLGGVQDPTVATQLQQQANAEMGKAVQDEGLEIAQYNELSRAISNDKELMERFKETQKEVAEEENQRSER